MAAVCLMMTPELRAVQEQVKGIGQMSNDAVFLANVSLWQGEQGKGRNMESVPTAEELNGFVERLNAKNEADRFLQEAASVFHAESALGDNDRMSRLSRTYDPRRLSQRTGLIAQAFTSFVTRELKKVMDSITEQMKTASQEEFAALTAQRNNLDRISVINSIGIRQIFEKIYALFNPDNVTYEKELAALSRKKNAGDYTDEQLQETARKNAEYRRDEYRKIRDNFGALSELAAMRLKTTENIIVSPTYLNAEEPEGLDTDEEGNITNTSDDVFKLETAVRDGWMNDARTTSAYDSLSRRSRNALMDIKQIDKDGNVIVDDLGYAVYMPANETHTRMLNILNDMIDSEDMIPLLEKNAARFPWLRQVINKLQSDELLFSSMYKDMKKSFVNYWIMRTDSKGKMSLVNLNAPEGISWIYGMVRGNVDGHVVLSDDSIYDDNGKILKDKVKTLHESLLKLANYVNDKKGVDKLTSPVRIDRLIDGGYVHTVGSMLRGVGVDVSDEQLQTTLVGYRDMQLSGKSIQTLPRNKQNPVGVLIKALLDIYTGAARGDADPTEDRITGDVVNKDFAQIWKSHYNDIARVLGDSGVADVEDGAKENGKQWYSHVAPSKLLDTIKKLKNVMSDKTLSEDEREQYATWYQKFINEEFGQYEFFQKDGEWLNTWLDLIVNHPEMRDELDHMQLLHFNGRDYSDWSALDYDMVMLNAYYSQDDKSGYAWYAVQIFSDKPAAEFIKFVRYRTSTGDTFAGADEENMGMLLEGFQKIVRQELDRIVDVCKRDEAIKSGDTSITRDSNYDKAYNKDGSIRRMGGAEFKFLPRLNRLWVNRGNPGDVSYEEGADKVRLVDWLMEAKENPGQGAEMRLVINNSLQIVLDDMFNEAMDQWRRDGLFDEQDGKYLHLVGSQFKGETIGTYRARLADMLINSNQLAAGSDIRSLLGSRWTDEMAMLEDVYRNNLVIDPLVEREIRGRIIDALRSVSNENDQVRKNIADSYIRNFSNEHWLEGRMREYFLNSTFATSQILQLTIGDSAYFNGPTDLQKRYAREHSPGLELNTKATYKGERVGRDYRRVIYLADDEVRSEMSAEIRHITEQAVKEGRLSKIDKDFIDSQYEKVNVADSQAYVTMESMRRMMIMGAGEGWSDDLERAYNNIKSGNWDITDFNALMQVKKPFTATDEAVRSVDGRMNKTPVTHKDSEYMLMAIYDTVTGPIKKDSKIRALNEFMVRYDIDAAIFESGVKSGKRGVININGDIDPSEVTRILEETTGVITGEDPNVIHSISYSDYREQQNVPEHVVDAVQLVGTQMRRLVCADIPAGTTLTLPGGAKMSVNEAITLYNAINTENILQAFKRVDAQFADINKLEAMLQSRVRQSYKSSPELLKAVTLVERDGRKQFNIPLFDPVISQMVQNLLNAYIRREINRQTIKGGSAVQVSSWGMSDDLSIVFYDKNGKTMMTRKEFAAAHPEIESKDIESAFSKYVEENYDRPAYAECYLPAYSKQFFEKCLVTKTEGNRTWQELDVNSLPDELRYVIGYRIPTEDKHSMLPMRIMGFLPQQSGSTIMLPKEITTIAGSDFDIDKMMLMFYEFNAFKDISNRKNFLNAFKATQTEKLSYDDLDIAYAQVVNSLAENGMELDPESLEGRMRQFLMDNSDIYLVDKFRKVRYDTSKSPDENGLRARNNMLMDIMWASITDRSTAVRLFRPGGFRSLRKSSAIMDIIRNMDEASIRQALGDNTRTSLLDLLENADFETLDGIAKGLNNTSEPLSPITQTHYHRLNMNGAKLIGIYAIHNVASSMAQQTDLGLSSAGSFVLNDNISLSKVNGMSSFSLHGQQNGRGDYITDTLADFIGGAVDNAKMPTLESMNQNLFTADASMLLARMGYTMTEIGLMMNQPIIREMSETFIKGGPGMTQSKAIGQTLAKYINLAQETGPYSESFKNYGFPANDLLRNIIVGQRVTGPVSYNQTEDYDVLQHYSRQVAVGTLFQDIMRSATALAELTRVTRPDSIANGADIADTIMRMMNARDFFDNAIADKKFPLVGYNVMSLASPDDFTSIEAMRDAMLESPLTFVNASYTMGIAGAARMLGTQFPYFRDEFIGAVNLLKQFSRYGKLDKKTIKSILEDYVAYQLSSIPAFGDSEDTVTDTEGESVRHWTTSAQKRRWFVNNFPQYFGMMKNIPEIASNAFVNALKFSRVTSKAPLLTVVLERTGKMSDELRDRYTMEWERMLYSPDERVREFALNLFRYSFYRSGFAFGPDTFAHLAPLSIRHAIQDYQDNLNGMIDKNEALVIGGVGVAVNGKVARVDKNFVDQYALNHTDNTKLWTPITDNEPAVNFRGADNNVVDSFTIDLNHIREADDEGITDAERSFVRGETPDGIDFMNYISRAEGGRTFYFIRSGGDEYTAEYSRVDRLGVPNQFKEYDYGSSAFEMEGAIDINSDTKILDSDITMYSAESDISDDPFGNTDLVTDDDFSAMFSESYTNFGNARLDIDSQASDITSLPVVEDFRDDNDDEICNGEFIRL